MRRLLGLGVVWGALSALACAVRPPAAVTPASVASAPPARGLETRFVAGGGTGDALDTVRAHLAAGDAQAARRRWGPARDAYRAAVRQLRARGLLADTPLRRLANTYYWQGRPFEAAAVLDTLAREAASFGDLPVEVGALLDAALLYQEAGYAAKARDRLSRVRRLLTSPFLPDSLRRRFAARLVVN